jgi:hypothetical protein
LLICSDRSFRGLTTPRRSLIVLWQAENKKLRKELYHSDKGHKYLVRRRKEVQLKAAVDAKGPVDALREAIEGATDAGVPPSLVGQVPSTMIELTIPGPRSCLLTIPGPRCAPPCFHQAEALLAQLVAIAAMEQADAAGNWKQLDAAINAAVNAAVEEGTIEPFRKKKAVMRATARLKVPCDDDRTSPPLPTPPRLTTLAHTSSPHHPWPHLLASPHQL